MGPQTTNLRKAIEGGKMGGIDFTNNWLLYRGY
jgi:hypothetical protein